MAPVVSTRSSFFLAQHIMALLDLFCAAYHAETLVSSV